MHVLLVSVALSNCFAVCCVRTLVQHLCQGNQARAVWECTFNHAQWQLSKCISMQASCSNGAFLQLFYSYKCLFVLSSCPHSSCICKGFAFNVLQEAGEALWALVQLSIWLWRSRLKTHKRAVCCRRQGKRWSPCVALCGPTMVLQSCCLQVKGW